LLNVGPRPDGVIDPAQANLLKEVGAWLAKNGESIYGTRGGPWKPTQSLTSTRKGNTIYLHVIKSEDGRVELPALPAQIKSAALLNGGKVECSQNNGKLSLTIPPSALEPMDTIVKIEVDRPAMEIPALTPASDIKATASNVFQGQNEEYGPQQAFDNDSQTRWATDSGTKQCWIAADLGKAATIQSVRISEAASYAGRVAKFEFQYRDGGEWKTIFSGTKIGAKFQKKFEPVKAQEFRLNILDTTEGPTIAEIELGEK
jgi:alpha-L-fucosidase